MTLAKISLIFTKLGLFLIGFQFITHLEKFYPVGKIRIDLEFGIAKHDHFLMFSVRKAFQEQKLPKIQKLPELPELSGLQELPELSDL